MLAITLKKFAIEMKLDEIERMLATQPSLQDRAYLSTRRQQLKRELRDE